MLSSISLVREKEQGTIVQVYASDLSAVEWLLGKELAYLVVGLGEALVVMTVATLLFGLRLRGDPTLLAVGLVIYLMAAVAFGLLVGARAGNQTGAVQGTAIAGFLTACCFPVSSTASRIFPSRCRCSPTSSRPATSSRSPATPSSGAPAGWGYGMRRSRSP
jgi:ABC-type multidrug transport system permease subunit